MNTIIHLCALCGLALALAGCGGGSSSDPPPPVTLEIAVSPGKTPVGQQAVLTWSSAGATDCVASGAWSGQQPVAGTLTLAAATPGMQSFALECTGPGGRATGSATLSVLAPAGSAGANVMQVTVDRGPTGNSFNMPFVSVTVCVPATESCRTVDRVLVDTGSVGLRLIASEVDITAALPAVSTPTGGAAATCGQFVSGFTWGSLRRADVRLGGSLAASLPVQLISDPSTPYNVIPAACSNIGFNQGTPAALGANGILGVGLFTRDCGERCVDSTVQRTYFRCDTAGCASSALALDSQISNPVAFLAGNDNGLSITLPPVPPGGASTLTGTLTFGLGTQPNNQLAGATVFPTDSQGYFTTVHKGRTYTRSFIDSGSNGIFYDDPDLPVCGDFYCPTQEVQQTARTVASNGAAGTVTFTVDNIFLLRPPVSALHAAGPYGLSQTFDWGLPFFFGRTVALALAGAQTPAGPGPYWAY